MELNTIKTTTYNETDAQPVGEKLELRRIPKLAWAGAILFGANLTIALGTWISPELNVSMYGIGDENAVAYAKPSAFTPVVDEQKRPVQAAVKLQPVVEPTPEAMSASYGYQPVGAGADGSWYNSMPRASQTAASVKSQPAAPVYQKAGYASGDQVYKIVEGETNYPRMSASLPRRTTPVTDVAPARVSPKLVEVN